MRIRSRRKLSMWSALPPYLGGKRRLCPLIFREIDQVVPRRRWEQLTFLDGFLGGGSVALYAKAQGFNVIATDIAERAIVVGKALIENSRVRLSREDVLRLAAPSDDPPGRIEATYVPSVFNRSVGRFLDKALKVATETPEPAKAALYKLLTIRVAMLSHPMSQVRKGTAHRASSGEWEAITPSCRFHYVDALRLTRPAKLWNLARQINAGVFAGQGVVRRADIMEVLSDIKADIAYFDPPYPGTTPHEKEYRVLDEILGDAGHPVSPFSSRDGTSMVDELLKRAAHIPVWVLSFGNAVTGIDDLEAKMKELGRETHAVEVKYAHKVSVASEIKKQMNREFVVVGWDQDLLSKISGDEYRSADQSLPHLQIGAQ